MSDWHEVHDSRAERPETLDTTSSAVIVYQRRNIRQETRPDMGGGTITEWVYDQRELTHEEYAEERNAQLRADVDFLAVMGGIEL